jgi:hypothetical protein
MQTLNYQFIHEGGKGDPSPDGKNRQFLIQIGSECDGAPDSFLRQGARTGQGYLQKLM